MARSKSKGFIAMSKSEKIRKLANAIKEFRGVTSSPVGAIKPDWIRTPKPHKLTRICELLRSLGFDQEKEKKAVQKIIGFKSYDEYNSWIKKLYV